MPPGYSPPGYGQPPSYPPGYAPPGYAPPGYGTQPGYPQGSQPPGYPYAYQYPNGYPGPATLPFVEGKPPPAGYHEESKVIKGLVIGGSVTFGTCYFLTLLAASVISEDNKNSWDSSKRDDSKALPLFIPALGPFIGLATLDPSSVGAGWLILDGVAQSAGLGMLIAGLTTHTKRYVRDDIMKVEWKIAPVVTGSHTGLGAVGRF
jgi:hypothetical protein